MRVIGPTLGDGSIAELAARLTARTPLDPFAALLNNPLMDLAGMVPVLNLFIGNGMDGTSYRPDGYNGGLLIGNGGDGWNSTTPGVAGGNGRLIGSGGKGGNGYSDIRTSGNATGTNGGKGGGSTNNNGGDGGDGGYAYGGSIVTTDPATGLKTVQVGNAIGGAGGHGTGSGPTFPSESTGDGGDGGDGGYAIAYGGNATGGNGGSGGNATSRLPLAVPLLGAVAVRRPLAPRGVASLLNRFCTWREAAGGAPA